MLLLAIGLLLSACGSAGYAFPDTETGTGGVAVFDTNGDGKLDTGDQPIAAGASIDRLAVRDTETGLAMSVLQGTQTSTTQDGGGFNVPQVGQVLTSADAGVQVGIPLPLENGRGAGFVHFRFPIDEDTSRNVALIPHEPSRCAPSDTGGAAPLPNECTLLLPDLAPIVDRSQIDEDNRGQTVAPSDGVSPRSPEHPGLLPGETWYIDADDDRQLLRFASLTANIGDGVLDVIAEPGSGDRQRSWQRLWGSDLSYWDRLSGEFVFHEGHAHIHFDSFERYQLLDADGTVVAESEKVSFCLRDSERIVGPGMATVGVFTTDISSCGTEQQSINPGWGDHYNQFLDDQWIDITGITAGTYTVKIIVDPLDLILEADETNNVGTFEVTW